MNGVINVFKPIGMTSFEVVKNIKKILNVKKIGHMGTLDPDASGVLPICLGKATRTSEYYLTEVKQYVAELSLGWETDTQDSSGNIVRVSNKIVTENEIIEVFESFKGIIYQVPPMYSALKHKGKKLYELARKGETVDRAKRRVNIYDLVILDILGNKKIIFKVKCSRGTYIRTLCNDIGYTLGTFGHMSYLIRTQIGDFKIEESVSLNRIAFKNDSGRIDDILIPIDEVLSMMPKINLDSSYYIKVINGALIYADKCLINYINIYPSDQLFRIYCNNMFIGVGILIEKNNNYYIKMKKVFI